MNVFNSVFDGLFGYEKLMLLCGFILFVFTLVAITVMIVQRRDFKMAMVLIIFAIVLMGFPGIQAVKFSQGMVELDRIRSQPAAPTDPAQTEQDQQLLSNLQQRAVGNPQLQAQVSDGYRAIGDVNAAYDLAKTVLQGKPSIEVQQTLIPVLTAKLNQVQANAPLAPPVSGMSSAPAQPGSTATVLPTASVTTNTPAAASPVAATPVEPAPGSAQPAPPPSMGTARQHEIADIARQLQGTAAPLPAASHAALAKAYVVLGQPQKAQANVDAALRLNPNIKINPAVLHAARMGGSPRPPER